LSQASHNNPQIIAGPFMAKTAVAGLDMKLVEIAMAYQRSRVLCAAARLGVADALKEGERSVQEIAGSRAADAATLHRLLRTLAAMGIVAQARRDTFVLTEFGENCVRTRLIPLGPPSSFGPTCWRTIGRLSRNACARAKARLLFGRKS
jgi:hypothetical protein